ncbi:MAG: zinc transporter substrate-binding protein [Friedmanniella sp.]|nr:zinc transporter substrate-binding protein [Friedmanniella sp.]
MKMIVMKIWSRTWGVLAAASLLMTAGCGQTTSGPVGGASTGRPLRVVASFYPFAFVAERVAGPYASVENLTQPGAEPHDVELTPRQVADLTRADLVVYEKSFQAAVDEGVSQSGSNNALDTASVVPLEPLAEAGGPGSAGEADTAHGGLDPHVWLDPTNMATIATEVGQRLAALDPAHATAYAANATALVGDLTRLDTAYRSGLASCTRTDFITTHAAFGYLSRRYGLGQIGISGLSPDAEPSPARIASVQGEAKAYGITTIFYETLVSPAVATSIATDLGLRTDVLDPLEGITEASRGTDYLSVMASNLTALQTANGCRS